MGDEELNIKCFSLSNKMELEIRKDFQLKISKYGEGFMGNKLYFFGGISMN